MHVTHHAIERFQERIRNVSDAEAIAALTTPAILRAAAFGAKFVRLGSGHRVVIADDSIVTVLPKDHWKASMDRRRDCNHHNRFEGE